jgi:hypothetical protein
VPAVEFPQLAEQLAKSARLAVLADWQGGM